MYKKTFWKTVLEIIHAIPIPPPCNCSWPTVLRDARTVRICPRVGKKISARALAHLSRRLFPIIGHNSSRTCLFLYTNLQALNMRTPDDITVPTRPMSETRARPGHETTCRHRERAVPVQSILVQSQSQLPCMQHGNQSLKRDERERERESQLPSRCDIRHVRERESRVRARAVSRSKSELTRAYKGRVRESHELPCMRHVRESESRVRASESESGA